MVGIFVVVGSGLSVRIFVVTFLHSGSEDPDKQIGFGRVTN